MARRDPAEAENNSVRSISSQDLIDDTHPNIVKTDKQLFAKGLVVLTVESGEEDAGSSVILTSSPEKYLEDDNIHVNSVHWYQNTLPDQVEERNKLCTYLLTRRGPPLIKYGDDGCELRTRFIRDKLPKLDLYAPVQESTKEWHSTSDRHIEDMFAKMRQHPKGTSNKSSGLDSEAETSEVTDDSTKTLQKNKPKEQREANYPLMKAFRLQAQRGCCRMAKQASNEVTTKATEGTRDVVKSPKQKKPSVKVEDEEQYQEEDQEADTEVAEVSNTLAKSPKKNKVSVKDEQVEEQDDFEADDKVVLRSSPRKRKAKAQLKSSNDDVSPSRGRHSRRKSPKLNEDHNETAAPDQQLPEELVVQEEQESENEMEDTGDSDSSSKSQGKQRSPSPKKPRKRKPRKGSPASRGKKSRKRKPKPSSASPRKRRDVHSSDEKAEDEDQELQSEESSGEEAAEDPNNEDSQRMSPKREPTASTTKKVTKKTGKSPVKKKKAKIAKKAKGAGAVNTMLSYLKKRQAE